MKSSRSSGRDKQKRGTRGAGYLYKRGGAYWLEYRPGGERVRCPLKDAAGEPITTKDAAEAERKRLVAPLLADDRVEAHRQVLARLKDAEATAEVAHQAAQDVLTFARAWDAYASSTSKPDSGVRTLADYHGHWKRFAKWGERRGLSDIESVTKQDASAYAAELRAGSSPNTYNKHTAFLRLFYGVMVKDERATRNPFDVVTARTLTPHSRRVLTLEELRTILEKADGELALLLGIGTFTGLRLGDCCTLQWGEVDLVRNTIRRVPNKSRGRKEDPAPVLIGIPPPLYARLTVTPPESRRGYLCPKMAARYIDIKTRSNITNAIRDHIVDCGIDVHAPGAGDRIVRNYDGTPARDKAGRVQTEREGEGRAVVEVGFHSLRHTFVSMHADRGTPMAIVQAIVGHGNATMTRRYTHIGEAVTVEAARALPAITGTNADTERREPLPDWARELIEKLPKSKIKSELLKGGVQ